MNVKIILIAVLLVGGGIYSVFFEDHPDSEMQEIADKFCACDSEPCRDEMMAKALKVGEKYDGKSVEESVADDWERAQDRFMKCAEASGYLLE